MKILNSEKEAFLHRNQRRNVSSYGGYILTL